MFLKQTVEKSWCAVFSLKPLTQYLRKEIMDMRRVNRFIPLPLLRSALPRAWNWSCGRHSGLVVWEVHFVKNYV